MGLLSIGVLAAVSGVVTDGSGKPMAGVKITVENTVFHASYVFGTTDEKGRYRVDVPNGSWKVHAQIVRDYHGKSYFFDLAPDVGEPFAGSAPATRNFTWKLTGPRGEVYGGGLYGARLTLVRGDFDDWYELHDLEVTLVPDGPLVDGSPGKTLVLRPAEGTDLVDDVPVGRYKLRVRHVPSGRARPVRIRNRGEYGAEAIVEFKSPFPESSRYGVEVEVASK